MCGAKIVRYFLTTEKFHRLASKEWSVQTQCYADHSGPYIKDGSFYCFRSVACTGVPLDATFIPHSGYYMQQGNRFHELKQSDNYFNDRQPIHFDYESSPDWITGTVEPGNFGFMFFKVKNTGTTAQWWTHHLGYVDQALEFKTDESLLQDTATKKWRFVQGCGSWGDEMIEADSNFIGYILDKTHSSLDQQYLYVFLVLTMGLPVAIMNAFPPQVFASKEDTWYLVFSTVTVELITT
jgi:hypothetical protein